MIKVIELFSGVGSQTQALKNIGVEHEVVGIAEIDKYAISSYVQLHGETKNFGDISKIENLPSADLWTYSFPCQDLSVAGKGAGIKEGTRSGLLFEVERLLEVSEKPKYLLMENVKNLVGKKNKPDFDRWCRKLEELGYKNYWQVLNAKDYGVPQNRERVFMVSVIGEHDAYEFPQKEELKIRLKDVLETQVEEKYYLKNDVVDKFISRQQKENNKSGIIMSGNIAGGYDQNGRVYSCDGTAPTISARDWKDAKKILQIGNIVSTGNFENPQRGRIYSPNGCSPALNCVGGGGLEPKILIKNATKKGFLEAEHGDYINLQFPESETRRGRVQKGVSATLMCNDNAGVLELNLQSVSNALTTVQKDNYVIAPPTIIKIDIPQTVKVRVHDINTVELCQFLRDCRKVPIQQIADTLNVPKTKVEHWFRLDSSFAIPDAEIWHQLKDVLDIKTDKYDLAITEFETRGGVYEKSERTYLVDGISPTLTVANTDEKILTADFRIRKLTPKECWRLMGWKDEQFDKIKGISNSQLYKQAGNGIVVNVLEKIFKNMF